MPRWRRPHPLVADTVLAILLALVSLVTVETGDGGNQEPVVHEGAVLFATHDVQINRPPDGLDPGAPWDAKITVRAGFSRPLPEVRPLVTIQNTSTGESTTYPSRPTGKRGVYRVRVRFPTAGVYRYDVLPYGAFPTVRIGKSTAAPESQMPDEGSDSGPFWLWPVALILLTSLPVALRRRYPGGVLAVTLLAALAMHFLYDNLLIPGAVIAMYTVAAHVGRPRSLGIAAATAVVLAVGAAKIMVDAPSFGALPELVSVGALFAVFGAAWLLGDNLRTRRAYLRGLEDRAATLEREREANERRAAAEEQARIARELHDIIAHNVSVMTVQAAAAGDVFETQPVRARQALDAIQSTGREALTELRRLLGNVRPGDGDFAPQPGLGRLDVLLEQMRTAGLPVKLTVEGTPRELPPGVDLSAYRIVQEALTNTIKHARASKASVIVRYGEKALDLEIVDDGRGASAEETEPGHGIIGMRERAALVGGELRAGSVPGGGFSVAARIPFE